MNYNKFEKDKKKREEEERIKQVWAEALDHIDKNAIAEAFKVGNKLGLYKPEARYNILTFQKDGYEFVIQRESLRHKAARLMRKKEREEQAVLNKILSGGPF